MFLGAREDKPFADLNTTASFSQYGVAFDYPGNWELSESDAGVKDGAKLHVMTLRTPSGAFMTIRSFEERMKLKVRTGRSACVKTTSAVLQRALRSSRPGPVKQLSAPSWERPEMG